MVLKVLKVFRLRSSGLNVVKFYLMCFQKLLFSLSTPLSYQMVADHMLVWRLIMAWFGMVWLVWYGHHDMTWLTQYRPGHGMVWYGQYGMVETIKTWLVAIWLKQYGGNNKDLAIWRFAASAAILLNSSSFVHVLQACFNVKTKCCFIWKFCISLSDK